MQLRFTTLDVFTRERFAGNPLAVVHGDHGLDGARMQTIAREFALPETVFLFPPTQFGHTAHLHIFTPATELPFAGHPTVGTAVYLGLNGQRISRPHDLILEERIGVVHCRVTQIGKGLAHAQFALPVLPRRLRWKSEIKAIASALELSPADIASNWFAPEKWSAGIDMCMVPIKSARALSSASPDLSMWEEAFGNRGPRAVYLFSAERKLPATRFRARMFAPLLGIREDPATGSAAAALAGVLTAHGRLGEGVHGITIEQGRDMGRPSTIELEFQIEGGKLTSAFIAGHAVIVSRGTLNA